eukprot:TRINITY_DN1502_c0_g1_i9.p1 TRINITY_DN1502_c0_g1~~TRINITY_DN1502_c0_g1_i9.p1  ORF type:complete len:832 (+),score=166.09 TRINITY_DN1502_c0_g1_i9:54-2549(+)
MKTAALLLGTFLSPVAGGGFSDDAKTFYGTLTAPGGGQDHIAWGHANVMAECKGTPGGKSDNAPQATAGGEVSADPVCLPLGLTPPEGGVMGDRGGRVLWTISNENVCTGFPWRMGQAAVPNDPDGGLVVSWAEDFGKSDFKAARTHLTLFKKDGSGAYQISKDIELMGCVLNGGVVFNKRGDIGTLCMTVCKTCQDQLKEYEPHIVEVKPDLSKEIRRGSIMRPECPTDTKYCYVLSGAKLEYLEYDPTRDVYAAWHSGGWGGHVADVLTIVEADPSLDLPIGCGGWSWACIGGHTEGTRMAYHPEWEDFGALCTADIVKDQGISYVPVMQTSGRPRTVIAEAAISGRQSQTTWPGSLVACDCHFYMVWHGVQTEASWETDKTTDIGFARLEPTDGTVLKKKWIVKGTATRERNSKLAILGTAKGCQRFAFGYGELSSFYIYPERYFVAELDGEGNFITDKLDVTTVTNWQEDEKWVTLGNGDVAWGTTWKRNNNGNPHNVAMKADGVTRQRDTAGCGCTYHGSGTGYGYNLLHRFHTKPEWSECKSRDGGCQYRDWGSSGFKTNEMFVTTLRSDIRLGTPNANDANIVARDRHPDCGPQPKISLMCRVEVNECDADPCPGQTCNDPDIKIRSDFTCTCTDDATIVRTGGPAQCSGDECETNPCSSEQACTDPTANDRTAQNDYICKCSNGQQAIGKSATCQFDECGSNPCGSGQKCKDSALLTSNDFECTCDSDPSKTNKGDPATCDQLLDECAAKPCGDGQTCIDDVMSSVSVGDFVCKCPRKGPQSTGSPANCDVENSDVGAGINGSGVVVLGQVLLFLSMTMVFAA